VKTNFFREELSRPKQVICFSISWWNWCYVNSEDNCVFFTLFFRKAK